MPKMKFLGSIEKMVYPVITIGLVISILGAWTNLGAMGTLATTLLIVVPLIWLMLKGVQKGFKFKDSELTLFGIGGLALGSMGTFGLLSEAGSTLGLFGIVAEALSPLVIGIGGGMIVLLVMGLVKKLI